MNAFLTVIVLIVAVIGLSFVSQIRRYFFIRPIFLKLKKAKSHISKMEKQALSAGNSGFEKSLFSGKPNWQELRALPSLNLTKEELDVLNGPVEKLCEITNDWDIRYKKRAIPDFLWDFVKKNKLFGLRVPKKRGGFSLSFQAQSLILGKIASRSVDVATLVELPTSLWPDEIVEKYGTEEQKKYYMPRFAQSKEIISFAITGISNGSDATAMRDVGIIEYGAYNGKKILGIRLNWQKRYITFAPKASLLVLGFQLFDPKNILGRGEDIGITLALMPTDFPGIKIGRRHLPTGVAFPNGPIWGEDVFIPIDWIIGGREGAGSGWKMIMECLFVGRAVALPSISIAAIKVATRYSTQYSRIRRQFGFPIGKFEGIEEPLAELTEIAYVTESARAVTTAMIDYGQRPLAVSSLMKYRTTEYARRAVNLAMDIHAGRAICDGPSNYLMSGFLAAPIGVTVEGANIVTRSIITFAQGVLQAHPYLYEELESCEEKDTEKGLKRFEKAFVRHILFLFSNIFRAFFHNLTQGIFAKSQNKVPKNISKWYKEVWKASSNFAVISDITTLLMGARLKKNQKLGGRLADALSELFLLSSVLKRYEDDSFPEKDYPIVKLCMINGLHRFYKSVSEAVYNFPVSFMKPILKSLIFPFGENYKTASDSLGHDVVQVIFEPGDTLDRLTRYIYLSENPEDITGRLEVAFKKSFVADAAQKKLDTAIRQGRIRRIYGRDWVSDARNAGILTPEEANDVRELEALAERAVSVDHFDSGDIEIT